jgi:hypothetical protein
MSGNMYPVAARAPIHAIALSGAGGVGRNCRKPFKPNTKKTRPRRSLAAVGAKREIEFMVVFLSLGSQKRVTFSGGLDEDELGILVSDHRETALVGRRDPIANGEGMTVHFHNASCRRDVSVAESAELVLDPSALEQRGSEYPRVRANGKSIAVARQAAGEDHPLVGSVRLGKTASVPLRRATFRTGPEPDLKEP